MPDQIALFATTAAAILGIVLAITWLKIPPVFALLFGTLFLGLTTATGPEGTTEAVAAGFADVMGEIGILIAFGVILGALLTVTDTMERLVQAILRVFSRRSVPYVFAGALSTLFTSIYSDVALVLSAPLARRLSPRLGRDGRALMGGALTAGIEVGLVFVVPGVAAVAIAAILGVPLGQMFVFGIAVGVPTALLTMLAFAALLRVVKWRPALDELEEADADEPRGGADTGNAGRREWPLLLSVSPVLLALVLVAGSAVAENLSVDAPAVVFLTDPVVALLLGAALAYALAARVRSTEEIGGAVGTALGQAGPILVLSGISGSLGMVIEKSGMAEVLGGAFSAGFLPPLLLVWLVAAVLHVALGSISVAGITAAGILAPIAATLDVPLVLVALAAGSGALFLPHVSSNFFWMFQSLLGFTTRGTVKTHAIPMTLASLISLPLILGLSVFV